MNNPQSLFCAEEKEGNLLSEAPSQEKSFVEGWLILCLLQVPFAYFTEKKQEKVNIKLKNRRGLASPQVPGKQIMMTSPVTIINDFIYSEVLETKTWNWNFLWKFIFS